jgi:hypothetical protein
MTRRHVAGLQDRARYARFGANDALVNDPDGYPSAYPPISWMGGGGAGPTAWWWGQDSGGGATPIGPNGPWANGSQAQAVITRATSLIVGPLSAAPYRVVADGTFGAPEKTPTWLSDPMLLRPDARVLNPAEQPTSAAVLRLARSTFWGGFVRHALHWGLGAFLSTPARQANDDPEGLPSGPPKAGSLKLIDPRFLSTQVDEDGALHWIIDGGQGDPAVFDRDGFLQLGPVTYRITVLRNPLSGVDPEGMSLGVFAMSPEAFQLGSQISSYMAGTFRSGVPAGYLKTETPGLSQTQADELKLKWMANHGGDRRSIAVLNATTSFVPLSFSPVDAAIGESKRLAIADVAFAFGMDPVTLNVSLANSATYNNVRDAWVNHRDYALSPWITALQDCLSALLAGTSGVLVSLDAFAQPDLKTRVETGKLAVDAGLITTDEWRASEGLPPLPKPKVPPQLQLVPPTDEPPPAEQVGPEPAPVRARPPAVRM